MKEFLEALGDIFFFLGEVDCFSQVVVQVEEVIRLMKWLAARALSSARAVSEDQFPVSVSNGEHAAG